jgi:hypothetical protein
MRSILFLFLPLCFALVFCSKKDSGGDTGTPPVAKPFVLRGISVEGTNAVAGSTLTLSGFQPEVQLRFSTAVMRSSTGGLQWTNAGGTAVPYTIQYGAGDSVLTLKPSAPLPPLAQFRLTIGDALRSATGLQPTSTAFVVMRTGLANSDKFTRITTDELMTAVQRQTFKYFWDFGHPASGMARERNTSGNVVTSGGSGMGVMAIIVGVHRGFITRAEGLDRVQKMVSFLGKKADRFKGAFPHWLHGASGKVEPFSANDNGADLVETALLLQGLITARQYFNGGGAAETSLRSEINEIWQNVEWDWFRKGGENKLYWHWSPDKEWVMNLPITGWNEALIVYVLAAASPTHSIPKVVYDEGWARNGAMRNGNTYYNEVLPLGPPQGGPLFFSHYSFLGLKPFGLKDQYADYEQQVKAHSLINYRYCVANPKGFLGYSDSCWGLTASDDNKVGYLAHEPQNDNGVIAPTAALSSMPYTPEQSKAAMEFFYYKLGDKLWKEYGFVDAFNLTDGWFADSFLAIDQGPIIIMLENHRSGLLWNLFMSAPEVRSGLTKLGFQY